MLRRGLASLFDSVSDCVLALEDRVAVLAGSTTAARSDHDEPDYSYVRRRTVEGAAGAATR